MQVPCLKGSVSTGNHQINKSVVFLLSEFDKLQGKSGNALTMMESKSKVFLVLLRVTCLAIVSEHFFGLATRVPRHRSLTCFTSL